MIEPRRLGEVAIDIVHHVRSQPNQLIITLDKNKEERHLKQGTDRIKSDSTPMTEDRHLMDKLVGKQG
jgi:hypothetical protein